MCNVLEFEGQRFSAVLIGAVCERTSAFIRWWDPNRMQLVPVFTPAGGGPAIVTLKTEGSAFQHGDGIAFAFFPHGAVDSAWFLMREGTSDDELTAAIEGLESTMTDNEVKFILSARGIAFGVDPHEPNFFRHVLQHLLGRPTHATEDWADGGRTFTLELNGTRVTARMAREPGAGPAGGWCETTEFADTINANNVYREAINQFHACPLPGLVLRGETIARWIRGAWGQTSEGTEV